MSDAIGWSGGPCPVHPMTIIRPRYRGAEDRGKGVRIDWPVCAGRLDWSHDGGADDIIAYHVVDTSNG